jgi:hypothetical protein
MENLLYLSWKQIISHFWQGRTGWLKKLSSLGKFTVKMYVIVFQMFNDVPYKSY